MDPVLQEPRLGVCEVPAVWDSMWRWNVDLSVGSGPELTLWSSQMVFKVTGEERGMSRTELWATTDLWR